MQHNHTSFGVEGCEAATSTETWSFRSASDNGEIRGIVAARRMVRLVIASTPHGGALRLAQSPVVTPGKLR